MRACRNTIVLLAPAFAAVFIVSVSCCFGCANLTAACGLVHTTSPGCQRPQGLHLASTSLPSISAGISNPDLPPPANWNEQLGLSFTQNFTSLSYNVTAVEQQDSYGYGPAYLLNGLSGIGDWYQVGVSWDWPNTNGGYNQGFNLNYEVFNSSGDSIFPTDGSGGLTTFSGVVNQGDTVGLSLNFLGGNVIMSAYDYETGASAQESFNAFGTSQFQGTIDSSDANGFFSGLMTEWYHVSQYYGGEEAVTYSDPAANLTSAWMWADEFNPNSQQTILFNDQKFVAYSNPTQFLSFSSNGTIESSDAFTFITGGNLAPPTPTPIPINMSYSVVGGGSGFQPPILTYTDGGIQKTATLSNSSTVYYADSGSTWSVTNPLSGSSGTETWKTQQASGAVTPNLEISFVYYHQYLVNLSYSTSDNKSGFIPPNATVEQFGAPQTITIPKILFIDASSQYFFQNPLQNSSLTERWFTATPQGNITSNSSISPLYIHQYALIANYSVTGGGNAEAPNLNGTSLGQAISEPIEFGPVTIWLDVGSEFSIPGSLLPSNSSERWPCPSELNGTMNGSIVFFPVYYHQYLVSFNYSIVGGGTPPPPVLNGTRFGSPVSLPFQMASTSSWFDSGTSYAFNFILNATQAERWVSNEFFSQGIISSTRALAPSFIHQFYLQTMSDSSVGGSIAPSSNWFDAGQQVSITATANSGWQFEFWNGSGDASYTGTSGSEPVTMGSPVVEYATFYPGLTISATNYGTVAVSYLNSNISVSVGSATGGTTKVLYVPLNSSVTLTATPIAYLFQFKQWTVGINSTNPQIQTLVSSPMSFQASFDVNWVNTGITIAAIAAVATILAWWTVRRKALRHKAQAPPPEQRQ